MNNLLKDDGSVVPVVDKIRVLLYKLDKSLKDKNFIVCSKKNSKKCWLCVIVILQLVLNKGLFHWNQQNFTTRSGFWMEELGAKNIQNT